MLYTTLTLSVAITAHLLNDEFGAELLRHSQLVQPADSLPAGVHLMVAERAEPSDEYDVIGSRVAGERARLSRHGPGGGRLGGQRRRLGRGRARRQFAGAGVGPWGARGRCAAVRAGRTGAQLRGGRRALGPATAVVRGGLMAGSLLRGHRQVHTGRQLKLESGPESQVLWGGTDRKPNTNMRLEERKEMSSALNLWCSKIGQVAWITYGDNNEAEKYMTMRQASD